LLPYYLAGARFADYDCYYVKRESIFMTTPFAYETDPVIELSESPHGSYTIFDLPPSALHAAEAIVAGLQTRAYRVHLLQGEDRPDGMASPYGIWPHPDKDALELIGQATGIEVVRAEDRLANLGKTALTAA
jgi:hypothetical protein